MNYDKILEECFELINTNYMHIATNYLRSKAEEHDQFIVTN